MKSSEKHIATKKLATDIAAIKGIGIGQWMKDYYWPMSDHDYFIIGNKIIDFYEELCLGINDEGYLDVVLSDNFLFSFTEYIHAMIIKHISREQGFEIVSTEMSRYLYSENWDYLLYSLERYKRSFQFVGIKQYLRQTILNSGKLFHWRSAEKCQAIGLPHNLAREYQKSVCKRVSYRSFADFVRSDDEPRCSNIEVPSEVMRQLSDFMDKVVNMLSAEYGIREFSTKKALRVWNARIKYFKSLYDSFVKISKVPEVLLFYNSCNPMSQILSFALRQRNVATVAFHHGHFMGEMRFRHNQYHEMVAFQKFVCPTAYSSKAFEENYQNVGISKRRAIEFINADTEYYQKLFERWRSKNKKDVVKVIMIVGFPMNAHRYLDTIGGYFYYQLQLQMRLVTILLNNGFRVIYKVHPDRITEAKGIFDVPGGVEFISKRFEDVCDIADAFIFTCSGTSTFSHAICTNKPIYLFDIEKSVWKTDFYELIQRRCVMIRSWFNERNAIDFNEDEFLGMLQNKQQEPCYDYVKTIMFSKSRSSKVRDYDENRHYPGSCGKQENKR